MKIGLELTFTYMLNTHRAKLLDLKRMSLIETDKTDLEWEFSTGLWPEKCLENKSRKKSFSLFPRITEKLMGKLLMYFNCASLCLNCICLYCCKPCPPTIVKFLNSLAWPVPPLA